MKDVLVGGENRVPILIQIFDLDVSLASQFRDMSRRSGRVSSLVAEFP